MSPCRYRFGSHSGGGSRTLPAVDYTFQATHLSQLSLAGEALEAELLEWLCQKFVLNLSCGQSEHLQLRCLGSIRNAFFPILLTFFRLPSEQPQPR